MKGFIGFCGIQSTLNRSAAVYEGGSLQLLKTNFQETHMMAEKIKIPNQFWKQNPLKKISAAQISYFSMTIFRRMN